MSQVHANHSADYREAGISEKTIFIRRAGTILAEIEQQTKLYQSKHNVGITLKPYSPLEFVERLSFLKIMVESLLSIPPGSEDMTKLKNTMGYLVALMKISETDPAYLFEASIIGHDARVLVANPDSVKRLCEHCECFGLDMESMILFQTFPDSLSSGQIEQKAKVDAFMIQDVRRSIDELSAIKRKLKREFAATHTSTDEEAQWNVLSGRTGKYLEGLLQMLKGLIPDDDYKRTCEELKAFKEELMVLSVTSQTGGTHKYAEMVVMPLHKAELYVRDKMRMMAVEKMTD